MSEITGTRYVIAVQNLKASAAFYQDVLGFEVSSLGDPSGNTGWLVFSNGSCVIMAGECPDDAPADELGSHSYFAYLNIKSVDEYHASVKEAGADLIKPLQDERWGMREFGVRTIDGHRIMFGEPIES